MELLSGTKGLQVTIDLKRVTAKKPFGFILELSPAGEESKSFVSYLIDPPIIFDREAKDGEVMKRCLCRLSMLTPETIVI